MKTRKANIKDLVSLVDLMHNFYLEGEIIEPFITKLILNPKRAFAKYLKESIGSKSSIIYIAEVDNKVVGFIRCTIKPNEPFFKIKKVSKLTDFYVLPDYRKKCIGNNLLSKVRVWCKKKKAPDLFLGTLSKNPKSNKIYLDKGFIEFERAYWKKIS